VERGFARSVSRSHVQTAAAGLRHSRAPFKAELLLLAPAIFILQMKLVQEAMDDGRKDNAHDGDQGDAAEQRVTAGKNLAAFSLQRRDRPHARQDHRGIHEGIHPRHLFKRVIADHPNAERDDDESHAKARVAREVLEIDFARQQRFDVMLGHDVQLAEPTASCKLFMPAISIR